MRRILSILLLSVAFLPISKAQDAYTVEVALPETNLAADGTTIIPMETVETAFNAVSAELFNEVFPAYTTIYFFNEAGEELKVSSTSPFSTNGISAYTTNEGISVSVKTNDIVEAQTFHLGKMDNATATHVDLRSEGYNITIVLSIGDNGDDPSDGEYTANAELPATHFPMSSSTQRITIPMDNVRTALEAVESGLYDQLFPSYTTIYFINEAGEELTVPNAWGGNGLSAYTTADGLSVSVPANTQFDKEVFHLGKLNISTSEHEDLRDQGYNFTIQLSAGETMPVVTVQSDASESMVEYINDLTPFEDAAGDRYDEIFANGSEYVLLDENGEALEGVSAYYNSFGGFYLQIAAGTSVAKGNYYLATVNDDGSYTDWRDEGITIYIVLTVDAPLLSEYEAEPIVVEDYDVYAPQTIEGYAESMMSLLGENLFNSTFSSGNTYKFRVVETGEVVDGVSLNLRTGTDDEYYFEMLISSESVSVDNERVQLTGFDWNIGEEGAAVDLDIDIYLNLTIAARTLVTGTLPETHLLFTGESATGTISLADLKADWDSQDPSYFTDVFADGNAYALYDAAYNTPNVEMYYSEEQNALEVTCYDSTVDENTYYLLDLQTYMPLNSMGYEVSIVFSVEDATSIDTQTGNGLRVIGNDGLLTVETPSPTTACIYNLSGQQVATANVDGTARISLPAGIYLVRAGETVCKAIVR